MTALAQSATTTSQCEAVPLLRTLVLCDLVNSTALVEKLGDQRAADLFRKHDRLARALLHSHAGREIDKTDGFLMMFDRPIQAVAFALDYQRSLRQLDENENAPLASRVGIHVGDVITWGNSPDDIAKGAKLVEVEGLVKPIASRLMQLALPNQILISGVTYSLAHRAQGELTGQLAGVRWRAHGRYRFKGIPDPIPVFEVGEEGHAPLRPPPWSGKAHREVPFWRRPATMVIEGILVLALVAVPAWYAVRPAPAIAFANRDWVVVGDLKNLTGESAFDASLATAFRIGLEQSRHVNVLSDLKTRETVTLMRRDPETTAIDRATGSEIAIRDGARALILPTVAEIGGRVRVTAEVVDPQTQTTVYSESADGVGAGSVLPSLDKVNQQLRVRLGEALATVSSESQPLEKVATRDLDALKAYSLGDRAYARGQMREAQAFYRQSLQSDPEFALAHAGLAKIAMSLDQSREAEREFATARSLTTRLSPREKLYVDAWLATFIDPRGALGKWKMLTSLYPGNFDGQYGFVLWQSANRFTEAVAAVRMSLIPQNPYQATSRQLLGALLLGSNRYDEAIAAFAASRASGIASQNEYLAMAHAAKRDFAAAGQALSEGKPFDLEARDFGGDVTRLALALDQGRWQEAQALLVSAKMRIAQDDTENVALFEGIELSLRSVLDRADKPRTTMRERRESLARAAAAPEASDEALFRGFMAAYLAAHAGDIRQAGELLSMASPAPAVAARASLGTHAMRRLAEAEMARVQGQPERAVAALKTLLDGSELYMTHVVLLDALADQGDTAGALAEAQWLSANRGRAFAEYNSRTLLTPYNIVAADLALLRRAELGALAGDAPQTKESLAAFEKLWPAARAIPAISDRIGKIRIPNERLTSAGSGANAAE